MPNLNTLHHRQTGVWVSRKACHSIRSATEEIQGVTRKTEDSNIYSRNIVSSDFRRTSAWLYRPLVMALTCMTSAHDVFIYLLCENKFKVESKEGSWIWINVTCVWKHVDWVDIWLQWAYVLFVLGEFSYKINVPFRDAYYDHNMLIIIVQAPVFSSSRNPYLVLSCHLYVYC